VQIADALLGPARELAKVLALHLLRPNENETFHAPDEAESEALIPLLSQAQARSLPVQPITFVSSDIPSDIAQTVANHHINLVLMGYHNPIFGKSMLGGTVHRVLTTCPTHVAVFVDRGLRNIDRILVPYLGSAHDSLALELAARIVRNTTAQATILQVVPPMTASAPKSAEAKRAVEKTFETQANSASVSFHVVEDSSPVGVVLHHARDFDLVIIGVAEQWGLESRLFGWRPEKIARDCPASLLIVRNFAKTQESTLNAALHQSAPSQNPRVAI
jgi:nucleotide-binding universal stress UspA family protein